MKKVFIGTPCYDGKIDVWFANSLIQTERIAAKRNIELIPIYMSYDSLVQRARNDCVALAMQLGCDDIVFIDADIEWEPQWFFDLLDYPVDVVGGTYRKKSDDSETYVVKQTNNNLSKNELGLIEVEGLGCGFVKFSKRAMQCLWDNSAPYIEEEKASQPKRMIFDVRVENGVLHSEDIVAFNTLRKHGYSVYLDPRMTCNHMGAKKFKGNFERWAEKYKHDLVRSGYILQAK
jgi:glycosyltransferase involved in cell wall biosynthesis